MPSSNSSDKLTLSIALPPKLRNDVNVQQAIKRLEDALSTSSDVHDVRENIRLALHCDQPAENPQTKRPSARGGSPSDWHKNEDQMTHGGDSSGPIWNDDDRVF